jgi:AcrR family transcriptional regulator
LKQGKIPTVGEVAEEALVSRATAYRYFPSRDSLLAEAPIEGLVPTPESVLNGDSSTDPAERADRVEAALHEMTFANETQIRAFLSQALLTENADQTLPRRQNRRVPLIEAALAPARSRLTDQDYARLVAALAVVFGIESMIVFRDVLNISAEEARAVKSWAIRSLIEASLAQSQ